MKEGWQKSTHVDVMTQILKYVDNDRSMIVMQAEIAMSTTEHEPARLRDYHRLCRNKAKRSKVVATLLRQIDVPQLRTLLARYLNARRRCRLQLLHLSIKIIEDKGRINASAGISSGDKFKDLLYG